MTNEPKKPGKKKDEGTEEIDLDQILLEIGNQGRVSVTRIEPDWAKGYVRAIQIQGNETISMDWLSEKFGGEKLQVRIYGADGKGIKAFRTVDICGPPRNGFGIEYVRGPDGTKCLITRYAEAQRRYAQLNGMEMPAVAPSPQEGTPAQPANQGFNLSTVLQTLITAQNTQNTTMTTMLVNRIGSLEQLLTRQVGQPAQGGPVEPPDPLGNLRNTVDVIAQLETVKQKMGISDREQPSETAGYVDLIKAFMEMKLEGQKAQVAQLQAQAAQAPALPQGQPPAPHGQPPAPPIQRQVQPGAQPQPGAPVETDNDLMKLAMERIETMPREERLKLASAVLGEPIDDDHREYFEEEDDPSEVENQFTDGQDPKNALDLAYNDETGDEHGSDQDRCSEPSPITDPSAPQKSAS